MAQVCAALVLQTTWTALYDARARCSPLELALSLPRSVERLKQYRRLDDGRWMPGTMGLFVDQPERRHQFRELLQVLHAHDQSLRRKVPAVSLRVVFKDFPEVMRETL